MERESRTVSKRGGVNGRGGTFIAFSFSEVSAMATVAPVRYRRVYVWVT